MEFLRVARRRSLLSETIYILLNLALAMGVLVFTWSTGTPWLALALVLLSKWRVLAVRPRYWFAHIEANMVDMIVGFGLVILIYLAGLQPGGKGTVAQILLGILYAIWLLVIKPRTRRAFIGVQAAVAITLGTMAISSISYEWPSSLVVLAIWLIGYSSARHVLVAHSDSDIRFMSLLWGFVFAELGWVMYHWTIAYSLPFSSGLKLPQSTLILLGVSFLAERVYSSYAKHETVRMNDIVLPMFLVLGVILVLLTVFNSASIGSI